MATMDVKDAAGATVAVEKPLAPGNLARAASKPVALDDESFALLGGIETAIADVETAIVNAATPLVDHDAVDSVKPLKVGYHAQAGLSGRTLTAANDMSDTVGGLDGSLYVRTVPLEDIVTGNATNTDGTSTSVIATAGAGIKQYLTQAIFANEHASTVAYVVLKSGTTAKTGRLAVPPGGATYHFSTPLPPNAANEAWNFDPDAAVTTLSCTLIGFKSKI